MAAGLPNARKAAESLVGELTAYVDRAVALAGGVTRALKPSQRVKFHWPPHPVSYSYHVLASDWTGCTELIVDGETFEVETARTSNGVFGRIPDLWIEERGDTQEHMLHNLGHSLEPLFKRQRAINRALEAIGRFTGHLRDLEPFDLIKLLYCEDRDVASDARSEIEKRASSGLFLPVLLAVLDDRRHPNRRSAQWCVLDLFEDLGSFCHTQEESASAITSIKALIWEAEDDYARTIYKAGVVLGGHIPYLFGGPALLECLNAPSKIGRRSAIHGLFHVVEWMPDARTQVVEALKHVAAVDPEPILREYARLMADDIASGDFDHVPDVVFPEEQ
jgi:hypothetical protein